MRERMACFCKDEDGITAIEYALIAALIFLAIIGSVAATGTSVQGLYQSVATEVSDALAN